jgi:hypothetical protein
LKEEIMRRKSRGILSWTVTSLFTLGLGAGVVLMTATNGVVIAASPTSSPTTSVATTVPTKVPTTAPTTAPTTRTITFHDDGKTYTVTTGSASTGTAGYTDY